MKKKKVVVVVAVVIEILTYVVFLGKIAAKDSGMFLLGMVLYPVPILITIVGTCIAAIAFIDRECNEVKAAGIGIISLGVTAQLGLFGVLGAVEANMMLHDAIIAIGGFGFGQYVFALFKPIVKSRRPGSDFGSWAVAHFCIFLKKLPIIS